MKKELIDNEIKESIKKITKHLDKSLEYLNKAADESSNAWKEVNKLEEAGYPRTEEEECDWDEFKYQLDVYHNKASSGLEESPVSMLPEVDEDN